ncbi:MAG TPA: hypothetical protein VGM92_05290 [Candidatus Kapabacteria bacterium]|jgi:hypothetical protein
MKARNRFEAIGRSLIAGLAGTAAITLSTMIEAKLRGRPDSKTPSKVGGKVMGVQPRDPSGGKRFNQIVHWQYGTMWGLFLAVADELGLRGAPASAAHFSALWSTELVMLPAANAAEPITEWGAEEIAIDAMHHAIYAATAGMVYDLLAPKEEVFEPIGTIKRFAKNLVENIELN